MEYVGEKYLIQKAKEKKIRIFVLNVNPKVKLTNLKKMTKETNGFYYELSHLNDAYHLFYEMKYITLCGINTKDKDEDGLLDVYETKGMRLCNGKLITSDASLKDTDSDGLSDYEEMGDLKYDTYTYTFATPNVTTDKGANTTKYENIFNLVNEDDLVPNLPLDTWGFKRYGTTYMKDMGSSEQAKFKKESKCSMAQ